MLGALGLQAAGGRGADAAAAGTAIAIAAVASAIMTNVLISLSLFLCQGWRIQSLAIGYAAFTRHRQVDRAGKASTASGRGSTA